MSKGADLFAAGRSISVEELQRLAAECEDQGRASGACWLLQTSEALWMAAELVAITASVALANGGRWGRVIGEIPREEVEP